MFERYIKHALRETETCFLWGPRQVGKSTLLKTVFPAAKRYDLLLSDEYFRLVQNPALIREECMASGLNGENQTEPIIIDEVQKVPELLDEVHWLMENLGLRFILCGSSARRVKRKGGNLLGGRAVRYQLFPLVYPEVPDFSLERALHSGLLPRHYLSKNPKRLLQSYVGDYLKEEIAQEAATRNLAAFSRFLEVAALSNSEIINYTNIASDCGVSSPTVRSYYEILEDTLIGHFIPAFRKRKKRRLIHAPKFIFFDVGIVGYLTRRGKVEPGSEVFGRAFEHFICLEVLAHSTYSELFYSIAYWRTASQFEVDLVLGDHEVAIEIKATTQTRSRHLKGLRAFKEEYKAEKYILVSLDPSPRLTEDGILILPWEEFLERLWSGDII